MLPCVLIAGEGPYKNPYQEVKPYEEFKAQAGLVTPLEPQQVDSAYSSLNGTPQLQAVAAQFMQSHSTSTPLAFESSTQANCSLVSLENAAGLLARRKQNKQNAKNNE